MTVKVLIVDDHLIVRAGVRSILENLPDVTVVAEAKDGREALGLVPQLRPDVIFMDISMKNLNGLETTARINKEYPGTHVLVLSMHTNEEYVLQALNAGAAGYLVKDSSSEEIADALRTVLRGETYHTAAIPRHVLANYVRHSTGEGKPAERLTPRQREILQLMAEGKSTKEIARVLEISTKTVETHRTQLMERLDIHDVAGLVRYAIRTGFVQSDR